MAFLIIMVWLLECGLALAVLVWLDSEPSTNVDARQVPKHDEDPRVCRGVSRWCQAKQKGPVPQDHCRSGALLVRRVGLEPTTR
jgi:hypothetical protein